MQKKEKIKKIFLLISIMPYIIFLGLGIINFIKLGIERRYFDLYEIIRPISDFWFDGVFSINIPL